MNGFPQMPRRPRSRGAAAVEFALIFPILFLLIYGVIVYSYIFALQSALYFAAQEAAEAAVKVDPSASNADDLRRSNARSTAVSVLNWLPDGQKSRVLGSNGDAVTVNFCAAGGSGCPSDSDGVIVTLTYRLREPTDLFPIINLPMVGPVPPMPTALTATATARI
jgi:Flp pilus assembly protein TadG